MRKRLLALIVLFVLVGSVMAQRIAFESANGLISFDYPEEWTLAETPQQVDITDGEITISFYSTEVTQNVVNQSGDDPTYRDVLDKILDLLSIVPTNLDPSVVIGQGEDQVTVLGTLEGNNLILMVEVPQRVGSELAFVQVTGPALSLVLRLDEIAEIVETYGSLIPVDTDNSQETQTQDNQQQQQTNTTIVVTATQAEACTVTVSNNSQAMTRVGPGPNRGSAFYLQTGQVYAIRGATLAEDGISWLALRDFNRSVYNGVWVDPRLVDTHGDCVNIPQVAASPVVLPQPTAAPVTPTPTTEPIPNATIEFYADGATTISPGMCVTLRWRVEGIQSVYFEGQGVSGPNGSRQVCPTATTTYNLNVTLRNGSPVNRYITITVIAACTQSAAPSNYGGTISVGGNNTTNISIVTCGQPITVVVDMQGSFDTYLEVLSPVYTYNDDFEGTFSHSRITVSLPAGTTNMQVRARSYNNAFGGNFLITITVQ